MNILLKNQKWGNSLMQYGEINTNCSNEKMLSDGFNDNSFMRQFQCFDRGFAHI